MVKFIIKNRVLLCIALISASLLVSNLLLKQHRPCCLLGMSYNDGVTFTSNQKKFAISGQGALV